MALILTHRFNWMGYEGTESEALNVGLLRACDDAGNLRYTDSNNRQQVIEEIRTRLKIIKRDLGLLPQEKEAVEGMDLDDIVLDSDDQEEPGYYDQLSARRSETPENGIDEYGGLLLYPKPSSNEDVKAATKAVGNGLRALLLQRGETYASFIDGREFTTLAELKEHNEQHYASLQEKLDGTGVEVPPQSEFDTTVLEAALEERNQCRMKLDAMRCINDPLYATRLREEERDGEGNPVTNVSAEDMDESTFVAHVNDAKKALAEERESYNKRARESAKRIQVAIVAKQELCEL